MYRISKVAKEKQELEKSFDSFLEASKFFDSLKVECSSKKEENITLLMERISGTNIETLRKVFIGRHF